jgi:hypothetical protein
VGFPPLGIPVETLHPGDEVVEVGDGVVDVVTAGGDVSRNLNELAAAVEQLDAGAVPGGDDGDPGAMAQTAVSGGEARLGRRR